MRLHVRSVSVLSGIAKLAGRTAGRGVIGVGIGVGGLTWADMKVDGFKSSMVDHLSTINGHLGSAYTVFADSTAAALTSTASTASRTAAAVSAAAAETWARTSMAVEANLDALRARLSDAFDQDDPSSDGHADEPHSGADAPPFIKPATVMAAAVATPFSLSSTTTDDDSPPPPPPLNAGDSTAALMALTRKLIEIRTILLSIGEDSGLSLPSIVVIGSQSSGKSSVLEAIVGREFLPKGDNMVTRRPIELTLIHTPPTPSDPHPTTYAEFPTLPTGRITDFSVVQRHLLDLNLAVPASECVSPDPIPLRIHSPHVPDLSLVDLPGYVQISSLDQPPELKDRIAQLCDRYIRSPNLILAVCAADVDLANSPALRASKAVDPLGLRTIGVVTKMDLVAPEVGAAILANERYPLALGYVGVVCKVPSSSSASGKGNTVAAAQGNPFKALAARESSYFSTHGEFFSRPGLLVGTDVLKARLMTVLEASMSSALHTIANAVQLELEDARYRFKVEYNDRTVSAESYVAETVDHLKRKIAALAQAFSKPTVRQLVKAHLDETVLDLLAAAYWNDPNVADLARPSRDDEGDRVYWERKLEAVASGLTKSGVGRTATQLVVDALRARLAGFGEEEPLVHHRAAGDRLRATADAILAERFALTSDQVENSVKPFKYEVEVERAEWDDGRARSAALVQRELAMCDAALAAIRDAVGGRKLRGAMQYVGELEEKERRRRERRREAKLAGASDDAADADDDLADPNRPVYNPALLAKAREAMFLSSRSSVLKLRLLALKSRRCRAGPEQKAYCPEAFLNVVADKLAHTAVQFINIELLVEFFYQFPREMDSRLGYNLARAEILQFANENPAVARHLALQDRKEKLELVADKLDTLVKMQRDSVAGGARRRPDSRRGLFGMF